jgi:hypothetical protein
MAAVGQELKATHDRVSDRDGSSAGDRSRRTAVREYLKQPPPSGERKRITPSWFHVPLCADAGAKICTNPPVTSTLFRLLPEMKATVPTVRRPEQLRRPERAGDRPCVQRVERPNPENPIPLPEEVAVKATAWPSGDSAQDAGDSLKLSFGGGDTTSRIARASVVARRDDMIVTASAVRLAIANSTPAVSHASRQPRRRGGDIVAAGPLPSRPTHFSACARSRAVCHRSFGCFARQRVNDLREERRHNLALRLRRPLALHIEQRRRVPLENGPNHAGFARTREGLPSRHHFVGRPHQRQTYRCARRRLLPRAVRGPCTGTVPTIVPFSVSVSD